MVEGKTDLTASNNSNGENHEEHCSEIRINIFWYRFVCFFFFCLVFFICLFVFQHRDIETKLKQWISQDTRETSFTAHIVTQMSKVIWFYYFIDFTISCQTNALKIFNFQDYRETKMSQFIVFSSKFEFKIPRKFITLNENPIRQSAR